MSNVGAEQLLVVQNPVCTRLDRVEEVMGWLMDSRWGEGLDVIRTVPPSEGSNIDLIRGALEPGMTVLGLGGDGLGHDVFNAIVAADQAGEVGADEVTMVPVPTGNGNDLSIALYGGNILRGGGAGLWDILERGEPTWLDGIRIDAGEHLDTYASSYVGFGFTAQTAFAINEPGFRERRARRDMVTARLMDGAKVFGAYWNRQPFRYENGSGPREAQELIYALAPRIGAGVVRLDTHLLDGELVHLEVGPRAFLPNAAVKLGAGVLSGTKAEYVAEDQRLVFHTDVDVQYDGEPDALPAGAVVDISQGRRIVRALI